MTDLEHAALDWIETAKNARTDQDRLAKAAIAQALATLAQTEQLRLANVIAWTTGSGYNPSPAVLAAMEKGLGL